MPKVTQGGSVTLTAAPQTAQGNAQDASDLNLEIVDADDATLAGFPVTDPDIVHDSFGHYHYVFDCPIDTPEQTLRGIWTGTGETDGGRIYGEDLIVVLPYGTIITDPTELTYATLDEFRHYLRIPDDDETDDDELTLALTASSRAIEHPSACNRQFGKSDASTTRTYTARWSTSWLRYVVEIDDLYSADDLTVTSGGTEVTSYTLEPINAVADGKPYTRILFEGSVSTLRNAIALTSTKWGWATVPVTIKKATLLQASRFFKRRDSPFGIAGSPEMGNEMRLLARLDPDVALMVKRYYRWRAG